ncbi:MAG: histidine phosphatase family protein [Cetobacterium sp.]
MKISLIRHAQTYANVNHILAGWTDVDVTEKGLLEIKNYKEKGYYKEGTHYFSSDLKRCLKTAKIIAPDKDILINHRLREINFGDDENKTYSEVGNENYFRNWANNNFKPFNGESIKEFKERVNLIINEIIQKNYNEENQIVIFTHSGFIRAILHNFFENEKGFWKFDVKNGLGYELQIDKVKKIKAIKPIGE